ncbi:MAG: flippase-like domain-containing protein [Pseudomonadota bacterium]
MINKKNIFKLLKVTFLLIGLAYLVHLILSLGVMTLLNQIFSMKFGFVLIMIVAFVEYFFHTIAWYYTFDVKSSCLNFPRMLKIWLGANGVKYLNPLGNVGGESYRLYILTQYVNKKEAAASMVSDSFSHIIMMILLMFIAFVIGIFVWPIDTKFIVAGSLFFLVFFLAFLFIFNFQQKGSFFHKIFLFLDKLVPFDISSFVEKFKKLDELISTYHIDGQKKFVYCCLHHFIGKAVSFFEIWIIMYCLGHQITLLDSFLVYAFIQLITVFFFFMPSQIGVAEGGIYYLFQYIGLSPEVGVAMALVRRVRLVTWAVLGYLIIIWGVKPGEKFKTVSLQP